MKNLLLFFSILLSFRAVAQTDTAKVIGIHTAVGKSISQEEKIKYHLFPEYKDSLFESARIVKLNDSTYEVVVHSTGGADIKSYISTQELDGMYFRIDEINRSDRAFAEKPAMTEEERKKIRHRQIASTMIQVLGEVFLLSLQVALSIALAN